MADVGGLVGDIGLNIAQLRKDVNSANRELARGTNRMNRHLGSLRRSVERSTSALKGLAVGAGIALLARQVRVVVSDVNELAKAAKTAGIEAESLQELRFAFGRTTSANIQQIDTSLQRFTRRVGLAAEGTGAAKDTFGELNVRLKDTRGNLRDTSTVLNEVLTALGEIESDAQRSAKASEVFGDEVGPKLAVALKGGVKELNNLRQRARETGYVLSNDLVKGSEQVEDRFSDLTSLMNKDLQRTVLNNRESLLSLAGGFLTLRNDVVEATGALAEFGSGLGKQLALLGKPDPTVGTRLGRLRTEADQLLSDPQVQALVRADRDGQEAYLETLLQTVSSEVRSAFEQYKQLRREIEVLRRTPPDNAGSDDGAKGPGKPDIPIDVARPDTRAEGLINNLLKRRRVLLDAIKTPQQIYNESVAELNELLRRNMITNDEHAKGLAIYKEVLKEATKETQSLDSLTADLGFTFQSAFEDAIVQGENLRRVVQGLGQDLARIAIRKSFTEPLGSLIGSKLNTLFNFGGGKAAGGPVMPGSTYLVGEEGPELFSPRSRGNIVPNDQLVGDVHVTHVNHFNGMTSADVATIRAALDRNKDQTKVELLDMIQRRRGAFS